MNTPRKMYRIELKSMKDIAKEAAILAALSNGNTHIPLDKIATGAEMECVKWPSLNDKISVNLIGDKCLTIDMGTENLLVLTEVEIYALDVPTLDRQLEGIDNPENAEAFN